MNRDELIEELEFCRKLADKLVDLAMHLPLYDTVLGEGKTRICSDIIRLRRELNEIRREVEQS